MICFKYYFMVLSGMFGIISSSDVARETSYINCLTWQDDHDWIQLICRVSDFVFPVTFFHNESETNVTCQIRKIEQGCNPTVEKFTVDVYSNTVTIVLFQKKAGTYLDGYWYCKQGKSIQRTDVSLTEGIIKDPSIYISGTVNNTSQTLTVECSSCRKPKGPYVEISINGKTEASLRQSEEGCFYRSNTPCSISNLCQCSETQNAFSLLLHNLNTSIPTNVSCDMQFFDPLKGSSFFVTVSHEFKGKDFRKTGRKITSRTNDHPRTIRPSTLETTVAVELNSSNPNVTTIPNVKTSFWIENSKIFIVSSAFFVVVLVLVFVLFYLLGRLRKRSKKYQKEQDEELGGLLETGTNEETDLLYKNKECMSCKKKSKAKIASTFCFNCGEKFCSTCIVKNIHALHIHVDISKFPSSFNLVSFFKCHDNYCHKYFCNNHRVLLCTKCRGNHGKCKTQDIDSVSENDVQSNYKEHMSELNRFKEILESYHTWLREGHEKYKIQVGKNSKLASVEEEKQDRYNKDTALFDVDINTSMSKVDTNKQLLELIETNAEHCHLFVALQRLKNDLVLLKKKTDVLKKSLYQLNVSSEENGNTKIIIEKINNGNGNTCLEQRSVMPPEKQRNIQRSINDVEESSIIEMEIKSPNEKFSCEMKTFTSANENTSPHKGGLRYVKSESNVPFIHKL